MKEINGTAYHDDTPDEVTKHLERCRQSRERIRLFYGKEGRCWNDEFDTLGRVGRSTGSQKIPLLIKSSRSLGGSAILDNCIVRIDSKDRDGTIITLYRDPTIHFDSFVATDLGTVYNETQDKLYTRCKSKEAGKRLAAFMNGKRWSK